MNQQVLNRQPLAEQPRSSLGSVLVVDDEEANRVLLKDALEVRGYEIAEAENGEQALRQVSEHPPDVILLDVMMPRMDGFEVCRHLKRDQKTAPIPILIVTALSERQERLTGIAAGANDFLIKPLDLPDVALRVANAVHTKALFDQLQEEREYSERLLLNILPESIAERMKKGEVTIADQHPNTTVLVADLVGLTTLSIHIGPDQVVCLLNEAFSAFDLIVEKHGLEKIKTMGDAYMVAGGINEPASNHAQAMATLALDFRKEIEQFNCSYSTSIRLRIGICTGPVVAGVIGRKKFAYDLWGDTVEVASRLGSLGAPGSITVAQSTYDQLKSGFQFQQKKLIDGLGPGSLTVYELNARI
jgi:adenylate cyclase